MGLSTWSSMDIVFASSSFSISISLFLICTRAYYYFRRGPNPLSNGFRVRVDSHNPSESGGQTGIVAIEAWFLYWMVAHFTLRTYDVNKAFFPKKIGFDDSFDVTKCLQQIEIPDSLRISAYCNE